jgi:hypothetical protein
VGAALRRPIREIRVAARNAAIKDDSLPKVMGEALEEPKPEAAYFCTDGDSAPVR